MGYKHNDRHRIDRSHVDHSRRGKGRGSVLLPTCAAGVRVDPEDCVMNQWFFLSEQGTTRGVHVADGKYGTCVRLSIRGSFMFRLVRLLMRASDAAIQC